MSEATDVLDKNGRFARVSLQVQPIARGREGVTIDRFLSYSFSSSVLVPVSSFSFEIKLADDFALKNYVRPGDIVTINAGENQISLCTGIVDTTEVETDGTSGERCYIVGRDLMSQLEDNDAISIKSVPMWGNATTIDEVMHHMLKHTRIRSDFANRGVTDKPLLFATEPGESKLTALQRFLEPINCLAWMSPDGRIIVGRPNMKQPPISEIYCSRADRQSNVLAIKSTRSETLVANIAVALWTGQETSANKTGKEQRFENPAEGPKRLRDANHLVIRTIVVSSPVSNNAQGLSDVNKLEAGSSSFLQGYAKRLVARENINELVVQVVMPGHFDPKGKPYVVDTVHHVYYDRDGIDDDLYCFGVSYEMSEAQGPTTRLQFCKFGSIVADVEAP